MQERHSKIVNLLDVKDRGETAFIFPPRAPLLFTNRSLHTYPVPMGLMNNCAGAPQLRFYLELAVLSTLVTNSGLGSEVPVGPWSIFPGSLGASSQRAAQVFLGQQECQPGCAPHCHLPCQEKKPFLPL